MCYLRQCITYYAQITCQLSNIIPHIPKSNNRITSLFTYNDCCNFPLNYLGRSASCASFPLYDNDISFVTNYIKTCYIIRTLAFSASINLSCSSSNFRLCVAAAAAADFSSLWRLSIAAFSSAKCRSIASSAAVAAASSRLSSLATASLAEPSLLRHSFALYNSISDILFKAIENGTTVWSQGVSL